MDRDYVHATITVSDCTHIVLRTRISLFKMFLLKREMLKWRKTKHYGTINIKSNNSL